MDVFKKIKSTFNKLFFKTMTIPHANTLGQKLISFGLSHAVAGKSK